MIAINKNTGDLFEIKDIFCDDTFKGICVKSYSGTFKKGEITKHLYQCDFYIALDWKDIRRLMNATKHLLL